MNLFLAITRKRQFKLLVLIIFDFIFSLAVIQLILENDNFYFKKILEINNLIGFLLFWILISYVRGRYLLTNYENILLKSIKDCKEIIVVSFLNEEVFPSVYKNKISEIFKLNKKFPKKVKK